MQKQLQHKRFVPMTVIPSSLPGCHWYVQANKSIEATGSYNDDIIHKRPCYIHV
ncbi:MAG: hypothetical protein JNN00_08240 [Chitinophagaceae bacterium]|nr:hypothetical protein [Chitinophagaceae bacterium]